MLRFMRGLFGVAALAALCTWLAGCGGAPKHQKKKTASQGPRAAESMARLKQSGLFTGYEEIVDAEGGLNTYLSGFRKKNPSGGVQITIYHKGRLAQGRVAQVSADFVGEDIPSSDALVKHLEQLFLACGYDGTEASALAKRLWNATPVKTKGATATREIKSGGDYGFVIDARGESRGYVKLSAMPKGLAKIRGH